MVGNKARMLTEKLWLIAASGRKRFTRKCLIKLTTLFFKDFLLFLFTSSGVLAGFLCLGNWVACVLYVLFLIISKQRGLVCENEARG